MFVVVRCSTNNPTIMRYIWFVLPCSPDEVKEQYRLLCKKHHPDVGGRTEDMQSINAEYKTALRDCLTAQGKSKKEVDEAMEFEQQFMDKVQSIIGVDGIQIELCGRWIWVTGNTYAVKNELKANGFFWASKKLAWYWRHADDIVYTSKKLDLDEIRAKHGSKVLTDRRAKLAA